MSVKTQDIDRVFKKLQMETRDSGDKLAWFRHNGKVVLNSRRSHGSGDIPGQIAHLIRQQLKVNEDVFRGLIKCPVSRDDYVEILRGKGFIE